MTTARQPIFALCCLATVCLPFSGVLGCDGEVVDVDEVFELSEWTEHIEVPADDTIEPLSQPCESYGAAASCQDTQEVAFCQYTDEAELEFGGCVPHEDLECVPGDLDSVDAGCPEGEVQISCYLLDGQPVWSDPFCADQGGDTPLVLRFDDAPITMIDASATPAATFDIAMSADGDSCITTDWPSADTPWLAVDLDHSGTIDGGRELFGSGTEIAGGRADNGFLALAPFDGNGDGIVDAKDPRFGELLLWRDHDDDRQANPGELETLADAGVQGLPVGYAIDRQCDARGNCGVERASFEHAGGRGELVDLHLPCR